MSIRFILSILLLLPMALLYGNENFRYHYKATVRKGDGVFSLLRRYQLADNPDNVKVFYDLNQLEQGDILRADMNYTLPVSIYSYNNESIRSTIGIDDWDVASKIAKYNKDLLASGIRTATYQSSGILWVPHHLVPLATEVEIELKTETVKRKTITEPLFGPGHAEVEVRSDALNGKVFYVISGHGGPDPGAMGLRFKNKLPEDEYAYDVSLRLARNLMEYGATVHLIIQDPDDGIRDDEFLEAGKDELCYGGQPIPVNQVKRLKQRTDVVNALHRQYVKKGMHDHTVIAIHIDSRPIRQRTDVFFYHYDRSRAARQLALNLHETFGDKYKIHRSNGAYHGTVSARNLYVLKHTNPPAVYVELANIQNPTDQIRITQAGNRQALANWLFEGLIK